MNVKSAMPVMPLAAALLLVVMMPAATAVDQLPKANAGPDKTINAGETVWLNGTGQDDGYIVKYEWDFNGDGTYDWNSVQSGNASHVYNIGGVFNATLRITTDTNQNATDIARITVKAVNKPPLADAGPDRTGEAGDMLAFNGTGIDPEHDISSYQWDFDGDGGWDYSGPEGTAVFTYKLAGEYTAYLRVTDGAMPPANDTDYCRVTIYPRNQRPAALAGQALTGTAGEPVTFVGKASDAEDSISLFEWDFDGDGTYDWSSNVSGVAVWRYPQSGTYTARLRVTDGAPIAASDVSTTTVIILARNSPPVITGPENLTTIAGRPLTLTVLAVDSDPGDSVQRFAWDFDDNGAPDSFSREGTVNWTFNSSGAHIVKVTAYDGRNASAWCKINVTAKEGPAPPDGVPDLLQYMAFLLLGLGAGVVAAAPATAWYMKEHWERFFRPSESERAQMRIELEAEEEARGTFRGPPGGLGNQ
jgi:PKD repeat protein